MLSLRLLAHRHFGNDGALVLYAFVEARILGWVDVVDAAGEHGNRARRQRSLMRGRIDAARKAGDDHKAGMPKAGRELPGEFASECRRIARAYDSDHLARKHIAIAEHGNYR